MSEHNDALVLELAVLVHVDTPALPRAESDARGRCHLGQSSYQAGPSAITYPISGCVHSAELKSPRSQATQIERTRSRFGDAKKDQDG